MTEIYYIKRGRRYVAVRQYDDGLLDALPQGSHMVIVTPGCRSTLYNVDPANAPALAAIETHKNKLCKVLMDASAMRPARAKLTERQAAAWEKLRKELGDSVATLHVDSANDIIEALSKAIQKEMK